MEDMALTVVSRSYGGALQPPAIAWQNKELDSDRGNFLSDF